MQRGISSSYWLCSKAKLSGSGDALNGIKSFSLLGAQDGQVRLARVGRRSQKGSTAEVE